MKYLNNATSTLLTTKLVENEWEIIISEKSFVMSLPDVSPNPSDIVCNVERKRIKELTEAAIGYHVEDSTVDTSTHNGNGHCSTGITSNGYPKEFGNLDRRQRGLDVMPFDLLVGELVEYKTTGKDGNVFLTNFRLFVSGNQFFFNLPIRLIEYVEMRDPYGLHVHCKDGKVLRIAFNTTEDCTECSRLITSNETSCTKVDEFFAFQYFSQMKNEEMNFESLSLRTSKQHPPKKTKSSQISCEASMYVDEIKRLGFNTKSIWRTTEINDKFGICETYPKYHIVPKWITDKDLETIARFRSLKRFPSVVWRSQQNGAVIARCSQPELGWFGWRCQEDESLLSAIAQAAKLDSSKVADIQHMSLSVNVNMKDSCTSHAPSFLLVDARSYAAAVANRAKGGGCEYQEYYPNCEIQFMGLPNIHAIRKSFHGVRALCLLGQEQSNWYSALEATRWLQNLSLLIKSACTIVEAIDVESRSTLIHCSDGWDRTPQLGSLAQLLLDPYYRTIKGFRVLVEREWLEFGHKFADRCGHSTERDHNERSPVFFQWLDAIHQVMRQFPSAFEFNEFFLIKLLHHSYSCLYGTFLCNSLKERRDLKVHTHTKSVWDLLLSGRKDFNNYLFDENSTKVLYPDHRVRCLNLWDNVFMGKIDFSSQTNLMESLSSQRFRRNGHCNGTAHSLGTNISLKANSECPTKSNNNYDSETYHNGGCVQNGETAHIQNGDTPHVQNGSTSCEEDNNSSSVDSKNNRYLNNQSGNSSYHSIKNENTLDSINSIEKTDKTSYNENHVTTQDDVTPDDVPTDDTDTSLDCQQNGSQESIISNGTHNTTLENVSMTDSCRTLTGTDPNAHRKSLDDLCLNAINMDHSMSLEHRANNMRRVHSSPDSPTLNRLVRTKSVPDVMASSVCVATDVAKQYPSLEPADTAEEQDYRCFIDEDGLTRCYDFLEQKLVDIELRHAQEVQRLQKKLDLERQARLYLQQQIFRDGGVNLETLQDDMLSLPDSVNGERSSLSSISNEEGWEQVQFDDVTPVRWIPDHMTQNCSSCGFHFNLMYRKHHCR
ncbi:myotubularin-related protein 4-like isoform X2 [Clytia hemisphaerica]